MGRLSVAEIIIALFIVAIPAVTILTIFFLEEIR
jgi:hypothetical protein